MRHRPLRALAAVLLLAPVALLACTVQPTGGDPAAANTRRLPQEAPSIVGVVTQRTGDRVRVEERPEEPSGSAKAVVRLGADTKVLRPDGSAARESDIVAGSRVRVWFTGPVAESYPVQAAAGTVVVE